MSETLSKQKMKDVINADWTRTTTQSPYYEGVRRTYNELLNDIDDGRFNTVIDYKAVTDRLQKESDYWNNEHSKETERADKLQKEIESLKAIKELAKQAFKDIDFQYMLWIDNEIDCSLAAENMDTIAEDTLSEIEKLQNE